MKTKYNKTQNVLGLALLFLAVVIGKAEATPVTDVVVNHFDDSTEADAWRFDYGSGGIVNALAFSTDDAATNAASGSLQLTMEFGVGLQQAAFTENLTTPIDASTFSSLEMDVKVDPGSALDKFGNAVYFQVALRVGSGFSYNKQFADNVAITSTNNGWRHIVAAPLVGSLDDIHGITLDLYDNNYTNAAPGADTIIYVDNIKFTKPDVVTPPPPPTLSIQPATPGLNLIPLGVNNRESIAAMDKGNTWVGSADPVKYAITISAYPDTNHAGFQTHLFLDADGADAADTYADYNRPNIVFLDIQNQANGSTFAAFRYKTNEPQKNTFLYSTGTLGGVTSPTAIGTWTLAFDHDTNLTVTAPNGGAFSTNIPPDVAALFNGPINLSLGGQANNNSTVGQVAVVSRFQITKGTNALLDDQFSADSALDPDKWQVAAVDPASVLLASPDSAFWLGWTLPDTGFVLQSNADITNTTGWVDSTLTATTYGPSKKVLLHSADEPNPSLGFFRLFKAAQ